MQQFGCNSAESCGTGRGFFATPDGRQHLRANLTSVAGTRLKVKRLAVPPTEAGLFNVR
jgi:hypothetical protein